MATRKLVLEADVKTEKAKAKLQRLSGMDGGGGGGDGPDRASKSLKTLGDSSERLNASMMRLVRGFGTMAVGLATSYAASRMKEGAARDAVEYIGAGLSGAGSGAVMGSTVGPVGTAVGAVVGAGAGIAKTYFDKDAAQEAYLEDFETSERRYREARDWKTRLEGMSGDGDQMRSTLAALREAETKIAESVRLFAEKGEYSNAAHNRESLAENRRRQAQLEAAIDAEDKKPGERTPSYGALDALERLGGDLGGGGGFRSLEQTGKDQLEVLKSIDRKTGGSSLWP